MNPTKTLVASGLALVAAFSLGFGASTAFAGEGPGRGGPGGGSIDPAQCATHCEEAAARLLARCEANNGENCADKAAEMLAKCQAFCANPPSREPGEPRGPKPGEPGEPRGPRPAPGEPREPVDCETLCAALAERAAVACEADPESHACQHLTEAAANCPERCANGGARPPRGTEPGEPGEPGGPGRGGPGGPGRPGRP